MADNKTTKEILDEIEEKLKKANRNKILKKVLLFIIIAAPIIVISLAIYFNQNSINIIKSSIKHDNKQEKRIEIIKEKTTDDMMKDLVDGLIEFDAKKVSDNIDYDIELGLDSQIKNIYKDALSQIKCEMIDEGKYKVQYLDLREGARASIRSDEDANIAFAKYYKNNKPTLCTIDLIVAKDDLSGKLLLTKEWIIILSAGLAAAVE